MRSFSLHSTTIPDQASPTTVGNKAYNIMVMSSLGLPVPKGFVIPIGDQQILPDSIWNEFQIYDLKFPVSVRSSGIVSMPGMMDTILNVGADYDETESEDIQIFKLNCYLRLMQSLATSVYEIDYRTFKVIEDAANDFYIDDDLAMNKKIIERFNDVWKSEYDDFPTDPKQQLWLAAAAVKQSWNSQRAVDYREAEGISHHGGTAVIVQEMVFGNRNENSGTGVVFSHNPNTGKAELYGDFLPVAQGEDVVSGTKIPRSIDSMLNDERFKLPGKQLKSHMSRLLRHFKFMQDVEFTVDDGKLYILQTRNAKCSPKAAVRSALSMINNGSMSVAEATDMVMHSLPNLDSKKLAVDDSSLVRLGFGIGVAEGEAIGLIATTKQFANELLADGKPYIFCAEITSPEDTEAMRHSVGVVTSMGGRLSHAAILARSMSKPTVVGFETMLVGDDGFSIDGEFYPNGEMIKIDGTTGAVHHASQ